MDISTRKEGEVDIVTVSGRVDSDTSPELDSKLKELTDARRSKIVAELTDVNYVSSAGLRALVAALRNCTKQRGKLVLVKPSGRVIEVLELAGLTSIFEIYDSTPAAVAILNQS